MKKIINLERFIKNKVIREWVEALIFALIVAGIFRTWLYAPYRVPTGSMLHTIEIGDHLFANKHAYGFAVPFTDKKLFTSPVKKGDIVIFPYPEDPSVDFIKRAVAVGGDKVEIVGETLIINGKIENRKSTFFDPRLPPSNEYQSIVVPKGKVFCMGDNRRNSRDSRYWGFVDEKNIQGKGEIIYFSHDPRQSVFTGYRFDRIGKLLR